MINNFPIIDDLRDRTCFKCGREIKFGEFFLRNRSIPTKRLIKLWNNTNIEYYCCLCYDTYKKRRKIEKIKRNLDRNDTEVIKALEKRLKINIPLIGCIHYNSVGYTISENRITGIGLFKVGLKVFPEEICYLDNLGVLYLPWNYLETVPDSLHRLTKLERLDLIGNNLLSIPKSIGSLESLREIDFSFNDLKELPKSMSSLKNLKVLKIIRNNIVAIPPKLKKRQEMGLKILI
jgi:Leucine-rich repeat (LRR) protein